MVVILIDCVQPYSAQRTNERVKTVSKKCKERKFSANSNVSQLI